VRVLAEIPAQDGPETRAGTLRGCDLDAFAALLQKLRDRRAVLVAGDPACRRAVSVGLATTAVVAGMRAALLECDLVRPTLADELGFAAAPGLHEYLRGEVGAESILEPLVLTGAAAAAAREPLICIVAGRPSPDGGALLESDLFRQATARLRAAYELLVLEAPSLAADESRWAALAAEADATIVCADSGERPPDLPIPVAGLVVQHRGVPQRS
jgi:Mrp family chromosome partitioning ATPase